MSNTYQYGIGRVRSIEAHLLTKQQLDRMMGAADFEAAFGILSETPYAEIMPKLTHSFDFEELVNLEFIALEELLLKLSLGNPIIKAIFATRNHEGAPFEVDRQYFADLSKACAATQSPLIKNFVKHKVDAINIKSVLRSRSKEELTAAFISGGLFPLSLILSLFGKPFEEIIGRLEFSPYFPTIKVSTPYELERAFDNFMINEFKRAKYLASGLEPLVGFYLAKEVELKTVRFILICKKNHVQNKEISERVRINY